MKNAIAEYIDSVLGGFRCYRLWRGGSWSCRVEPDYGGWSTGIEIWRRQ